MRQRGRVETLETVINNVHSQNSFLNIKYKSDGRSECAEVKEMKARL